MKTRLLGLVAVVALVATACGSGAASSAAPGPSEGITVHGEWTIEVYDADGTLAESVEFSNALDSIGAEHLALLLSGQLVAGEWHVEIGNYAPGSHPCTDGAGSGDTCRATQVWDFQPNFFPTLVVDSSVAGQLTLDGSVVVENDTSITAVETRLATCTVGTNDCLNTGYAPASFSGTLLDTPVPVSSGQTVQVEVVISFS